MNFFKHILSSCLGAFLAMALVIALIVVVVVVSVSSGGDDESEARVRENSVLHVVLDQPVVERGNDNDLNFDITSMEARRKMGLNHFIADMKRASSDDHIEGVLLEVKNFMAAPSSLFDLREAISAVRDSGKWVVAYAESYSQGGYFLASAADEIYLYPEGDIDWRGINAEITFFKKLLDKLGIEAQVIRGPDNKFKSAVEPFMYEEMSPANEAQMADFVGDIWRIMLQGISEDRNVSQEQLMAYADSLAFSRPEYAVEAGLITGLKYRDEVLEMINVKTKGEEAANDTTAFGVKKGPLLVDLHDYHKKRGDISENKKSLGDKVAVVYAVGAIESGEGDDETIGSDRIAAALKKAREDKKVKAIVLRVNSPGGSALASDVIWRETQLIKQSGKPFIVSMSDYAASGGYYIACAADKIYANANTITGSIGVFGVIPNMQKFFDEKLGVTFDRVETNPHADLVSVSKPLDEREMQYMQDMVSGIYENFTQIVAEGRGLTVAQVDSIGQGRVWSGEDAKRLGLVDEIGDLEDAVREAASMAGITDYGVKELPELIDPVEELIAELTGQKKAEIVKELLGDESVKFEQLQQAVKLKGVQARLPFFIEIR